MQRLSHIVAAFRTVLDATSVVASREHHRESRERCVEVFLRLRRRIKARPDFALEKSENEKNLHWGRSKE